MQRNNGYMIIQSSNTSVLKAQLSSATIEPWQRISNIYIYLYVSDQSVLIWVRVKIKDNVGLWQLDIKTIR